MHHAIASNNFLVLGKIVEILVVDVVKERLEFSRREIVGTVKGGNVLAEGEFKLSIGRFNASARSKPTRKTHLAWPTKSTKHDQVLAIMAML
eukprot:9405769-Ditylum_brightwellii.AAC.1